VAKDGSLVTVEARVLETLHSITDVIDIDRDGTPELVGSDWLGMDRILTRADGDTVVQHLDMPFYGCPC
jgi:hypothetical protein